MFLSAVPVVLLLLSSQASAPVPAGPDIELLDAAKLGQLDRTKELLSRAPGSTPRTGAALRR